MGLFNKKKDDNGEDSSRRALFSSKSKSKSQTAPEENPYAQLPPDPYTQAKMRAGLVPGREPASQPQQESYGGRQQQGARRDPYTNQSSNGHDKNGPSYDSKMQGGYPPNSYWDEKGYGSARQGGNPYAQGSHISGGQSSGYGGLGPSRDDELDANRDALFGGASKRLDQQQQQQGGPPGYQYQGDPDSSEGQSYGAYGDRQLTAEEEEEEDVAATKQEIKFIKQQDVSSTRNALQAAAMAEETGRNTLARLGAQGERIHSTEQNLNIGHNAINIAEDRSKELKTLNRSMFAVHVSNPFTAKDRRVKDEEKLMERHQLEREQREATRQAAFQSTARMNSNFKGLSETSGGLPKQTLAERAKYQFEADSDDERMEDEIEKNIDELGGAAKRLNVLARAMGEEADAQNAHLVKIADKVRLAVWINQCSLTNGFSSRIAWTTGSTCRLSGSRGSGKWVFRFRRCPMFCGA